ncbi:LD-carboxypeptidase [Selenomonas sp. KH1T6]
MYFAGTDSTRATDLNRFFGDDEVQAILCPRDMARIMCICP